MPDYGAKALCSIIDKVASGLIGHGALSIGRNTACHSPPFPALPGPSPAGGCRPRSAGPGGLKLAPTTSRRSHETSSRRRQPDQPGFRRDGRASTSWSTTPAAAAIVPGMAGRILDGDDRGAATRCWFSKPTSGHRLLSIEAARVMTGQGTGGSILNIASVDGLAPAPTEALSHGAAKAAILELHPRSSSPISSAMPRHQGQRFIALEVTLVRVLTATSGCRLLTTWTIRSLFSSAQPHRAASRYRAGCPVPLAPMTRVGCRRSTLPVCGGQYGTSDIFRWTRAHNSVPASKKI